MLSLLACILAAVPAAAAQTPAAILPGAYVLDASRAETWVRVPMMGVSRANLQLRAIDGRLAYDAAGIGGSRVTLRMHSRAVNADASPMNRAVARYFESDRYPVIRFAAAGYDADAEGRGQITGDLTFHGVTRPITLAVDLDAIPGAAGSPPRLAFTGRGKIRRSEFGITAARAFASDAVDLAFTVEFVKK